MRGRRTAWVVESDRIILVKGFRVADVLRDAGFKPLYLGTRQAFSLDHRHLADVLAVLEREGFNVIVNLPPEAGGAA